MEAINDFRQTLSKKISSLKGDITKRNNEIKSRQGKGRNKPNDQDRLFLDKKIELLTNLSETLEKLDLAINSHTDKTFDSLDEVSKMFLVSLSQKNKDVVDAYIDSIDNIERRKNIRDMYNQIKLNVKNEKEKVEEIIDVNVSEQPEIQQLSEIQDVMLSSQPEASQPVQIKRSRKRNVDRVMKNLKKEIEKEQLPQIKQNPMEEQVEEEMAVRDLNVDLPSGRPIVKSDPQKLLKCAEYEMDQRREELRLLSSYKLSPDIQLNDFGYLKMINDEMNNRGITYPLVPSKINLTAGRPIGKKGNDNYVPQITMASKQEFINEIENVMKEKNAKKKITNELTQLLQLEYQDPIYQLPALSNLQNRQNQPSISELPPLSDLLELPQKLQRSTRKKMPQIAIDFPLGKQLDVLPPQYQSVPPPQSQYQPVPPPQSYIPQLFPVQYAPLKKKRATRKPAKKAVKKTAKKKIDPDTKKSNQVINKLKNLCKTVGKTKNKKLKSLCGKIKKIK